MIFVRKTSLPLLRRGCVYGLVEGFEIKGLTIKLDSSANGGWDGIPLSQIPMPEEGLGYVDTRTLVEFGNSTPVEMLKHRGIDEDLELEDDDTIFAVFEPADIHLLIDTLQNTLNESINPDHGSCASRTGRNAQHRPSSCNHWDQPRYAGTDESEERRSPLVQHRQEDFLRCIRDQGVA